MAGNKQVVGHARVLFIHKLVRAINKLRELGGGSPVHSSVICPLRRLAPWVLSVWSLGMVLKNNLPQYIVSLNICKML